MVSVAILTKLIEGKAPSLLQNYVCIYREMKVKFSLQMDTTTSLKSDRLACVTMIRYSGVYYNDTLDLGYV